MSIYMSNSFDRAILLFWAIWFSIVSASDFTNLLQVLGVLPDDIPFNSHNFDLIIQTLSTYSMFQYFWLSISLFIILIAWAVGLAYLFWRAFFMHQLRQAIQAFAISFMMTATFIITDELFIQYPFEHNHTIRLSFQILTFFLYFMGYRLNQKQS